MTLNDENGLIFAMSGRMASNDFIETMAQKDRISVDVTDIKEQVEKFRNDPAWRELSLASKVRVLVLERLEMESDRHE